MAVEMNDSEEEAVNICSVPSHYAGGFLWGCIKIESLTVNIFLKLLTFCNVKRL